MNPFSVPRILPVLYYTYVQVIKQIDFGQLYPYIAMSGFGGFVEYILYAFIIAVNFEGYKLFHSSHKSGHTKLFSDSFQKYDIFEITCLVNVILWVKYKALISWYLSPIGCSCISFVHDVNIKLLVY